MSSKLKWGVILFAVFIFGYATGSGGKSSTTGIRQSTVSSDSKQTSTTSQEKKETEASPSASPVVEKPTGKVEVKSHKKKIDSGYPKIVGEVVNNAEKPTSFVKVTATYYDKSGEVAGTGFTYAGDTASTPLQPESTAPFEITDINKTDYATYKLDITWN